MSNEHRYPIWFSDDDYQKLLFQANSGHMAVEIKGLGEFMGRVIDENLINEILVVVSPGHKHITELTCKKIRGRNIPIIPKD